MRILIISTIYPNQAMPVHAVFVRNRIRELAKSCVLKVVSPIPYFPFATLVNRYAIRKNIPFYEHQEGIDVYLPRFLSIPRFLKPLDGFFLFLTIFSVYRKLTKNFDFDLIDAQLAYPDGFAAVLLGMVVRKPVIITLRGHDVNDSPCFLVRRYQIRYALRKADRVFSVAQALKDEAVRLGIEPDKIKVIPNGVDKFKFYKADKLSVRKRINLPTNKKIILSVGHLCERKGFHYIIRALSVLRKRGSRDLYLVIVGGPGVEGNIRDQLLQEIRNESLEDNVLLTGPKPHEELFLWYSASDVFCLASSKEGRANVLLEAMACGLPIVATKVWGTPEIISSKDYGILVDSQDPNVIATALEEALNVTWDSGKIMDYASGQSWKAVSEKILKEFEDAQKVHGQTGALVPKATRKQSAKKIISRLIQIFVIPLYMYYKMESFVLGVQKSFQGISQLLSVIPGILGQYVRKEFYKLSLTHCSDRCVIEFGTLFSTPDCCVGENVYIGPNCVIGRAMIENDVLIGNNAHLLSGNRQHGYSDIWTPIHAQQGVYETIRIGEDTWIGNGAIILADVGKKCVVGAASVVTKPVENYCIVAGNQANPIRKRT